MNILKGARTSASQKSHWWIITTHHAGAPLNLDGGNQSQKTSSLLGQAHHLTWCTNIYPKTINHTWAPSATSKRPQINTVKGTPVRTRYRTRPISAIHAVRRHQSCLPRDIGFNREILHGPNRKVPSYIHSFQIHCFEEDKIGVF